MPITTRNIAKGVPPRLHGPKSKSRKRVRAGSDSSENSAPKPKAKKKNKHWHEVVETESEVEEVEDVDPPMQEVEDDTIQVSDEAANKQEVSTIIRCTCPTH
jgi:hypothetical protein